MNRQPLQNHTPSHPDASPRSDRFRCGGRESNFLAAMKKLLMIVGMMVAAGMVFGQGMDPKALAEAQKAAKEKALENSRAVLQDQLRRFTETKGTITGRFAITTTFEPREGVCPTGGVCLEHRCNGELNVCRNCASKTADHHLYLCGECSRSLGVCGNCLRKTAPGPDEKRGTEGKPKRETAGNHFRASIEVRASDGRVEVDRVAFGEAGGWTHTNKTAEFKVQGVPLRPGVNYWIVVRAYTCPLTHVFKPTPKSDVRGYWDPQECKGTPVTGKGRDLSRIPVTFGSQNTVDVGEIAVEPQPAASPDAGHSVTLRGTAIPQVDHNALVDRTKYNIVLEVVDEHDKYTQYAVRINDISRQHIASYRGGTGVAITGSVEAEGNLKVITPTRIEVLPRPIKP